MERGRDKGENDSLKARIPDKVCFIVNYVVFIDTGNL